MIINGKEIASEIFTNLKIRVNQLKKQGLIPHLYIILLSDDPASASYVKQKLLRGEEIGVKITLDKEQENITTEQLIKKIGKLNQDNSIHGIIVQRPMPIHLNEEIIANTIVAEKDIDGFNKTSNFEIPVAMAVITLLKNAHPDNFSNWISSQKISVIGSGLTAGKPIINALKKLKLNPSVITSKTNNIHDSLINSDIIISAAGKANVVNVEDIKKDVILIGVGLHKEEDNRFHGDYTEENIAQKALYYSPTPGGVGPVNVAMLLTNLVSATEKLLDKLQKSDNN